MKKALKIAAIILASIFVLITAVIATIPLWFPVEKVRHIIIDELSEKTGREVSVKSLSFNILKGFELKGFVIKESKRYG
ncbi:MAG TPA: AsmA family protein, partial [Candidatus Goldiibacteriota bacterium]|nr:AsmA family protein [Candidatus Goldiibacteriota bacterium]